ncbi:MAG TPA: GNAT family N-acetyltransferase [Egibacteraceae bacterium]|nr:GNAT family N-acetyltransferase [Egibacteraceae bacterium]
MLPPPAGSPETILDVYCRAPEVHPYGIADVAQLWEQSRWWRRGDAVVGLMELPGSPVDVLYAVSADADTQTLALAHDLLPELPDRVMATGPRGLSQTLSGYDAGFCRPYLKMHLAAPERLPAADPDVTTITRDDLPDLLALFDTDPVAGDFFHPGLLDTGLYVGTRRRGDLVAVGGIHVIDETHGVAAIGNVTTRPDYRRQGLGVAVMATLVQRLLERVETIGLNVREANVAARRLYEGLGFCTVAKYEECELVRR